jgi:hypothetical protein
MSLPPAAGAHLGITRDLPGLCEKVAPKIGALEFKPALASRHAGAGKELSNMRCVRCKREVARTSNWLRIRLWGEVATFHWRCFAEFLRSSGEDQAGKCTAPSDRE